MISSDLQSTINKIIPQPQNLLPVSFKRKLRYKGYFLEEIIDWKKVLTYFQWLKKYNHLYKVFILKKIQMLSLSLSPSCSITCTRLFCQALLLCMDHYGYICIPNQIKLLKRGLEGETTKLKMWIKEELHP